MHLVGPSGTRRTQNQTITEKTKIFGQVPALYCKSPDQKSSFELFQCTLDHGLYVDQSAGFPGQPLEMHRNIYDRGHYISASKKSKHHLLTCFFDAFARPLVTRRSWAVTNRNTLKHMDYYCTVQADTCQSMGAAPRASDPSPNQSPFKGRFPHNCQHT